MTSRHLPAAARAARPWRNGGGVTRDVAIFPHGAGDDDFLWRASLATIADAGPFSAWPGVDRTFMPLRGEVLIAVDNGPVRRLVAGDPAIDFAGEAAVTARPAGNECTVLNLMARRGRIRTRLERWDAARATAADQLLLVAEAPTRVQLGDWSFGLKTHDALRLGPMEIATLESDRAVIVAEMFAIGD
ncbi:MAG: HutD/Ves family protein [Allosphingosinicella sp.]